MDIKQETHGQVLLVAPSGRLDSETSGELELVLHDAGTAGCRHFVIDLAAVGYVSSAGLRVMLALAKRLDGGVGSVRLCGLSAPVRQVFDISGFSAMFQMFPNREAALDRHPHMLDASGALVAAAAALLGAQSERAENPKANDQQVSTAAELLGAPVPHDEMQQRSTMMRPSVDVAPSKAPEAPEKPSGSRWKRLFGKD